MRVAYWPGCVSRGFTPELHGSMAKVAPLLDIELIELDRAADRRRADDEHLLDVPGRAIRMPGAARRQQRVPRAHQRQPVRGGPALREGPDQQEPAVAAGRGDGLGRLEGPRQASADRPAR